MFKNIQFLRAFAAVSVMVFHGASLLGESLPGHDFWVRIASFGYVGVDIFFVVSGFVATHGVMSQGGRHFSMFQYLGRRLIRIFSGYWPFYFMSIVVAFFYSPDLLARWDLVKSFFLIFWVGHDDGRALVVYVAWSLTYEIAFYVIFSIFQFIPSGVVKRVLVAAPPVLVAVSLYWVPKYEGAWLIFFAFFSEFVLGALAYFFAVRWSPRGGLWIAGVASILGLVAGVVLKADTPPLRIITFGFFSWGLVSSVVLLERVHDYVASPGFLCLGDASYVLYLSHTIIFSLVGFLGFAAAWTASGYAGREYLGVLIFMGIIGFSCLYSAYIKMPIYRGLLRIAGFRS